MNLPLVAKKAQAARVVELQLQGCIQCLDDLGAAAPQTRIFFRHLIENVLDVANARLTGGARRRCEQAARHRRVPLVDHGLRMNLILGEVPQSR